VTVTIYITENSTVLVEKLLVPLVSLPWAKLIQSPPLPFYLFMKFILILSCHVCIGLPIQPLLSGFPAKPCMNKVQTAITFKQLKVEI
jgi:hypothetical protein